MLTRILTCVLLASLSLTTVRGQETGEVQFELPQNPRAWINSPPISTQAMKGKAIVLYFFEEGCPRCREKWPAILAANQASQSQPVMLIAVNSGSTPDQVARYVKQQRINIPVIMDVDRSLERAAGVNEVSLKNIWQARIVGPDGDLKRANGGDIPATLQSAAADASWNVDPSLMPVAMMPTWRQVEFGDYASASRMVNRFVKDRRPDVKAAGEALQNHVNEQLNTMVQQAGEAIDSGETWRAFRLYETIEVQFAGYDLPEVVSQQLSALKKDDSIGQQIEAMRLWKTTEKMSQSGRASPTRVKAMLEAIIKKHPGTEAASMAEAAIGR